MKAKVDPGVCIGCGLCVQTCPEVFELEEDKAVTKAEAVPKNVEENCKQAAQDCPVEAISVE